MSLIEVEEEELRLFELRQRGVPARPTSEERILRLMADLDRERPPRNFDAEIDRLQVRARAQAS